MKREEFMELLKQEGISEFAKLKGYVSEDIDRDNGYSAEINALMNAITVFERVATVATINALEKAGFIRFDG